MKDKKDSFLIVRINHKQKEALLAAAKKSKVSLSTKVREMIEEWQETQGS